MLGFILFNLIGCADYTMSGIKLRNAEALVHPLQLDFGHLVSGQETDEKYFTITNTGDVDLIVSSPVLNYGDGKYLMQDIGEVVIPSGELVQVDVSYIPTTYETNEGFIEFQTSDENNQTIQVSLIGHGDAPVMSVEPLEFDYGTISLGCDNEERVTITNDGNLPLQVNSVTQMVTQPADIIMEFGSLPELPWTIEPEQSLDFLVSYIPSDIGDDESQIMIEGSDPALEEAVANQFGTAVTEQDFVDTYVQEEIPVVDILWVVDDSGSMARFQNSLSSNISLFMNVFAQSQADYHMAVITTTTHVPMGMVIDQSHADPVSALQSEILVGIYGSGMEMGLEASLLALSDSSQAGPGGFFFREWANLVVIYVSDEKDYSQSMMSYYYNFFDQLKPAGNFIPYAVIGDYPSGCNLQPSNVPIQFGERYWDLVDYYGGSWYSICSPDWGSNLQNLAMNVTGRWKYNLSEPDPIEETIVVKINGQIVNNWNYDSINNQIDFGIENAPEPGATIDIEYSVWGCYE